MTAFISYNIKKNDRTTDEININMFKNIVQELKEY